MSIIVAMMIVPLIAMLAVAGEVSSWYTVNRNLQNAADASAIAAARNATTTNDAGGIPQYQREAKAVAAQYGFVSGTNNITVTPTTVTCPSGTGTCYQVTISRVLPVMLSHIVGFTGSTTLNGNAAQTVSALAIATPQGGGASFCLLALGGSVNSGVQVNGGPKSDLSGCSVGSNGSETCNGHDLGADSGYAYYTDSGCGAVQHSNYGQKFGDALDAARAVPTNPNPCSSYPQESQGTLPDTNLMQSSYTGGGTTQFFCGDVALSDKTVTTDKKGNTVTTYSPSTVTLAAGTTIVINNGTLDIPSGATLNGAGVTIIFTGSTVAGLTPSYYPTGGGTMNISAPSSGNFAGVAVWQDPSLPAQTVTQNGNSPTWDITGMVYLPVSNLTISGAVGKDNNGACMGLVVNTITINGTGYIIDHGCGGTSTTLPGIAGTLVALVQ